jgi:hypothetical protein
VHHILVYYEAPPDGPRVPPAIQPNREDSRIESREASGNRPPRDTGFPTRLLATYAPGTDAQVFPEGTALRLAPGGLLHLQVHYTANGTAGTDRSKVGLVFAKEAPGEEMRASQFLNARFTIPPGAVDHEVTTDVTFLQDATIRGLFPHTHVRGKRWSYTLELPDGTKKPLLSVPKYDFNWQTYYMFREPIAVPKGARIVSTAWYDNSTANKSNPRSDDRREVGRPDVGGDAVHRHPVLGEALRHGPPRGGPSSFRRPDPRALWRRPRAGRS